MEVGEYFFHYFHTSIFSPLQHTDSQVVTKAHFGRRGSSAGKILKLRYPTAAPRGYCRAKRGAIRRGRNGKEMNVLSDSAPFGRAIRRRSAGPLKQTDVCFAYCLFHFSFQIQASLIEKKNKTDARFSSDVCLFVEVVGFEPATPCLQSKCSTS